MKPVIYIMGVSGSGKTTIGKLLAQQTGIPFFDGDDFHSLPNKKKMAAGQPLDDEDRKEWLLALNSLALEQTFSDGAIIACSALKEKYRRVLQQGLLQTIWVFLQGTFEQVKNRLQSRSDHFMPATLLQSQFDILEIPEYAIPVNISLSTEDAVHLILQQL
ncbi:MAG: gluconokinase [Ferruginibacter sp.]